MNPKGSAAKYHTVHEAPTDEQLAAHAEGVITLAGCLIGRDGLAAVGVIELDAGSEEAASRVLAEAERRGIRLLAVVCPGAKGHNGSHLWAPYAERCDPAAIRHQLAEVARAAEVSDGEIYPKGAAIRLLFGRHTWTNTRGVLLTQDGQRHELDSPEGRAAGWSTWATLERNPAPPPAPAPERPQLRPAAPVDRQRGESPIAAFNAAHNVRDLAISYGATFKGDRGACNCGVDHDGETQLAITSMGYLATYSSRCRWRIPGKGAIDAFDLYAIVEHGGDKRAARAALVAQQPRKGPNYPPHPAEAAEHRHTAPEAAEARRLEAERKREQRRRAVAVTLEAVATRLADDAEISDTAREVLYLLLADAAGRPWCSPSKASLAARLECSERTVQRALVWLEGRYITTEQHTNAAGERWSGGHKGTPRRTFLREPVCGIAAPQTAAVGETPGEPITPAVSSELDITSDLKTMQDACEGGAAQPAGDPGEPDADEWTALLAGPAPAADDLVDPAALAAVAVEGGFCEVPAELLPAVEAPALALVAPTPPAPACEQAEPVAIGPVRFTGGASFNPATAVPLAEQPPALPDAERWRQRPKDALTDAECYRAVLDAWQRPAASPTPAVEQHPLAEVEMALEHAELVAAEQAERDAGRAYSLTKASGDKAAQNRAFWALKAARDHATQVRERHGTRPAPPSPAPGAVQGELFGYQPPAPNRPAAAFGPSGD